MPPKPAPNPHRPMPLPEDWQGDERTRSTCERRNLHHETAIALFRRYARTSRRKSTNWADAFAEWIFLGVPEPLDTKPATGRPQATPEPSAATPDTKDTPPSVDLGALFADEIRKREQRVRELQIEVQAYREMLAQAFAGIVSSRMVAHV